VRARRREGKVEQKSSTRRCGKNEGRPKNNIRRKVHYDVNGTMFDLDQLHCFWGSRIVSNLVTYKQPKRRLARALSDMIDVHCRSWLPDPPNWRRL
jgi:hypothetical protein